VRYGDSEKTLNESSKTLRNRIKIELIVEDSEVEKAVNVILRQAQPESDEKGGQITVLEVTEIQRLTRGQAFNV
jgi:nitrogen regulatory protein PII